MTDEHIVREIEGLRSDFREFSVEIRAVLRTITDPVTGYVPRSEHTEMRENLFRAVNQCDRRIDSMKTWVISLAVSFTIMLVGFGSLVYNVARAH